MTTRYDYSALKVGTTTPTQVKCGSTQVYRLLCGNTDYIHKYLDYYHSTTLTFTITIKGYYYEESSCYGDNYDFKIEKISVQLSATNGGDLTTAWVKISDFEVYIRDSYYNNNWVVSGEQNDYTKYSGNSWDWGYWDQNSASRSRWTGYQYLQIFVYGELTVSWYYPSGLNDSNTWHDIHYASLPATALSVSPSEIKGGWNNGDFTITKNITVTCPQKRVIIKQEY